jgi:hypothetical protein
MTCALALIYLDSCYLSYFQRYEIWRKDGDGEADFVA